MAKILIADDVAAFRDLASKVLQSRGHTVLLAEDGQRALELVQSEHPDLLVADVSMPVMGGLEVLRRIRQIPSCQHLPVIIVSAAAPSHDVRQAAELQVADFLLKSRFTLKEFANTVEAHLPVASAA